MTYKHKKIESKWQAIWEKQRIYTAKNKSKKGKQYVLIEFPYPSGEGLHMGHLRPYVAGDVYSRCLRMQGNEVMYPIGWDAFGLPAENFAIKQGIHPSITTAKNIENAKRQLKSWGIGFDWSREINTTDPGYYKWTQWLFLQFFKAGLAYEATGLINWCPKDMTGLANEEVIDGRCERCGTIVEKEEMRQWYLKITAYAEKLLKGLKTLDWPEPVKIQQENWIGKSEGAEIEFRIMHQESGIKRFILIPGRGGSPERNFIPSLRAKLEQAGYEVIAPFMPSPGEPNDLEQAEFIIKKFKPDDKTAVVGHSFGGVVALRILESGIKLGKVFLVGTPHSGKFLDGKIRASITQAVRKGFDFEKIKKNCKNFVAVFDTNDYVVPLSDGEAFSKKLDINLIKIQAVKPHFTAEEELELGNIILPSINVFTTRPDTIFGATYMVLAPEHPLVENFKFQISNFKDAEEYIEQARKKTDIQRTALDKEKTGVELKGIKAINPATREEIPVWIADYVLMGYGTGAIMAVPQHDERDRQFAKKFLLPIVDKPLVPIEEAIKKFGKAKVQYKLRDWVFSRQRYWGEPIPIIHCKECGTVPVPEKDLPVKLPKVKKYEPTGTGESPLAVIDKWVNVKCPQCKGPAKRETNTMPQWAGSSWYYLRYCDPKNRKKFADENLLKLWLPVDTYFGGMEHTTLHLLYSRFWHLFLHDQGLVPSPEPYTRRVPHGIVLGPDGEKMSKSRGNVVNPDEVVSEFGADALRMYELFLGPHEAMVSWNSEGILGVSRFLEKVWRVFEKAKIKNKNVKLKSSIEKLLNKTIKKVGEDIANFRFNTAVSAMMIFVNEISAQGTVHSKQQAEVFLKLLAPFAPHMAEELWHKLGNKTSIHLEPWPEYDEKLVLDEEVNIVVQVNGKVRGILKVAAEATQEEVEKLAKADENVKRYLIGKIKKIVYVKGKIINFVT